MSAALFLVLTVATFSLALTAVTWRRTALALRQPSDEKRGAWYSAWVYCLLALSFFCWVLIYGSLVPFWFKSHDPWSAAQAFARHFAGGLQVSSRSDWFGNILVTTPIGFFGLAVLSLPPRRWLRSLAPAIVLPCCALLSLGVEFAQVFAPVRYSSAADVVAQAAARGWAPAVGW